MDVQFGDESNDSSDIIVLSSEYHTCCQLQCIPQQITRDMREDGKSGEEDPLAAAGQNKGLLLAS